MPGRLKASHIVLALLCAMYFITYLDRVNIGAAAAPIKAQFHLSNTQLGLIFSGFAYPYLCCQVVGGLISDRWGARRTLVICGLVWAGATILTGLAMGFVSMFATRLLLGLGEGATFPAATQAMQTWFPADRRGFAQGLTHSFSRLGNAVTAPVVAALTVAFGWRSSFVIVGLVSLVWIVLWGLYFRDDPRRRGGVSTEEIERLPSMRQMRSVQIPWVSLACKIAPVTLTYFCYAWILWLYLNWLPLFFKTSYHMDIQKSAVFAAGVFVAGVVGDTLGGVGSDRLLKLTGNVRFSRLALIVGGFVGAAVSLGALLISHDLTIVAISLSAGFFFAELVVGPIWATPMDIAPEHCGTAAGLMNIGSASAAIVSPIVGGWLIDATGNWYLPFIVSMGMLALGSACAFLMPLGACPAVENAPEREGARC
jgi:sugar phosphate permease